MSVAEQLKQQAQKVVEDRKHHNDVLFNMMYDAIMIDILKCAENGCNYKEQFKTADAEQLRTMLLIRANFQPTDVIIEHLYGYHESLTGHSNIHVLLLPP